MSFLPLRGIKDVKHPPLIYGEQDTYLCHSDLINCAVTKADI